MRIRAAAALAVVPVLRPAYLPPSQLPSVSVSGNTIDFTGGTLKTGEPFQLNLRLMPAPTPGMGGQAYGRIMGTTTWQGPFTITGP